MGNPPLMVNPPHLRNILVVYYSIKFRTECPEKNGKSGRFCKRIFIFEIIDGAIDFADTGMAAESQL